MSVSMRNFATLAVFAAGANALVPRDTSCCFQITASGDASGTVGQLGDGQNRIGGNLPPGQYCIDQNGGLTDGNGRGCILTPPTTQFQCDAGATPTPGFSINSNGQLEYNGQTGFVACETGENGGKNIYTSPDSGDVTNCINVQLMADSCSGSPTSGAGPSSSAPASSTPVMSPSPSASSPGGGAGGGGGEFPSPSQPAGGGEGPTQSTTTVPVVSPSPSGGAGGGGGESPSGGGEGPTQSTTTVPVVSPSPSGGAGGGDCSECLPTTTLYTTVTVDCGTETPSAPGGGGGGETPTMPAGGGETPTSPAGGGGEIPTSPAGGGGEIPTSPAGGGETPTSPAGGGETPTSPAGGGEIPTSPAGGGETPTSPAGGGETPTSPAGGGETPTSTAGGGETPTSPAGGGETPTGPSGGGQTPTPSTGSCPTDLSGNYEFPHLIVPIDSSSPDNAPGSSFNGTVTDTVSTIFNFDIPQSDAGKTCSLVFLFPNKEDLETSSYSFSGDGKVSFGALESPAELSTSYSNAPAVSQNLGDFTISPGNSYSISSFECPAGKAIGVEMSNAGSTQLDFFEDYNPSPLGLYITVC
ncbi:ubiquitin 3 binding protein But2 C-terminal domain-containing protein [Aspergillus oleicola]